MNPVVWRREWDSNPRVLDGHQLTRKPKISRLTPFRVDDLPSLGTPARSLSITFQFYSLDVPAIFENKNSRSEGGEFADIIVKSFRL
jgi:hypothetical protein